MHNTSFKSVFPLLVSALEGFIISLVTVIFISFVKADISSFISFPST